MEGAFGRRYVGIRFVTGRELPKVLPLTEEFFK